MLLPTLTQIDIRSVRVDQGGDPELLKASEMKRGRDPSRVDMLIELDQAWRKAVFAIETHKADVNSVNKEIGQRKKTDRSDNCQDLLEKSAGLKARMPELEAALAESAAKRDALLHSMGNFVLEGVPVSNDEAENLVVRKWGAVDTSVTFDGSQPGKLRHHEVLAKLNGYKPAKGAEIAGHRAYFLTGYGAMLNFAIAQYGMSFLRRRGYENVYPPFFMRKEVMAETAELADFDDTLYRIPMGKEAKDAPSKEEQDNDMYLIATSEQPISALHRGEFLEPKSLPYRYSGFSTCFRKEAGSHGKDMWGIFRVHQFEKVEQFVLCAPEDSEKIHEEMCGVSEEFYRSLGLPYRVVAIVSGALNDAAAKKYDLEAWFPGYGDYRELVSCSNCTDFQSRALEVRFGYPNQGDREKTYVHMLNGTLVATQRTLCCLLENYQTETGVRVPEPLRPYMDDMEFLPYPEVKLP